MMINGAILYSLLLSNLSSKISLFQTHKNTSSNTQTILLSLTTYKEWIINIACLTMTCSWWDNKVLHCVFNTTALVTHAQDMCFKTVASLFMIHRLVLLQMIIWTQTLPQILSSITRQILRQVDCLVQHVLMVTILYMIWATK